MSPTLRYRTVGVDAVLVEVDDAAHVASLAAVARAQGLAREVVPGATTVLLDGIRIAPGAALDALRHGAVDAALDPGVAVEIPVTYDGPDLAAVAEHWGVGQTDVVRIHTHTEFVAQFCGFSPGFAYLAGLAARYTTPRLATPRPRVAAGAVAVAGPWCGVYPTATPGGWQVIGSTDAVLWDPDRPDPATLSPGARVRFVEVA